MSGFGGSSEFGAGLVKALPRGSFARIGAERLAALPSASRQDCALGPVLDWLSGSEGAGGGLGEGGLGKGGLGGGLGGPGGSPEMVPSRSPGGWRKSLSEAGGC